MNFRLELVVDMPNKFEPEILYVSEECEIACHLCACGCDVPVYTPLGPTEWKFSDRDGLPTLRPSIGNWTIPCRSHYWIKDGRIVWAGSWSDAQVNAGRDAEAQRRNNHYETKARYTNGLIGWLKLLWDWLFKR